MRGASRSTDIAVVGYACRFPGAPDADAFWTLLRDSGDAVTDVPPSRWDWRACYDPNPESGRKTNSRWGGFLDGIEDFDAWFFNIAPREARLIDPQQRLVLEVAWEALEHAGHAGDELAGAPVGVFVGCSHNGYYGRIAPALSPTDYAAGIANQNAIIANRVSFFLDLHGPSVLVDTMCSSSLVALHHACQSLRLDECSMALAGAVNVLLSPEYYVAMSRMKAHAPDGRCKAFDHRANGIVLGEGAGMVVLKPLAAALDAGDTVHAVIRGSAVNHGGQANGLTAPNPQAQAELIRTALRAADVAPETITYVEAHGTGTALGDPVELEGLVKSFGVANGRVPWCAVGSVKTNIGHLECASGMSGFIKVLLAIAHRELPALVHFEKPNPLLHLTGTPFRLVSARERWTAPGPLRAGISSFGIAGTNAHVVVEEPPAIEREAAPAGAPYLVPLSAKTPTALAALRRRHREFIERTPDVALSDIAFTLQNGRSHFPYRWATVCRSRDELLAALGETTAAHVADALPPESSRIAFVCPGAHDDVDGLTRALYESEPVFRCAVDRLERVLRDPSPPLFVLQVALAELWRSWGIVPDTLAGDGAGAAAAESIAADLDLDAAVALSKRAAASGRVPQPTDCDLQVALPCGDGGDPRHALLEQLATLYRAGVRIHWSAVSRAGHRIPLPGYPFERRRHWIDLPATLPGPPGHASENTHPLLGVQVGPAGAAVLFERRLTADDPPFLTEHRVGSTALFPATAFFELALAAGTRALGQGRVSVKDCVLHAPLRLDTALRMQTVVVRTRDGATVQCLSAPALADETGAAWTLHVSGRLCAEARGDASAVAPARPGVLGSELDVNVHYDDLQARGFHLGPRFRGLRAVCRTSREVAADVEWPGDVSELAGYTAHPALLDACLHALAATFSEEQRAAVQLARFVPARCARLTIYRALPPRLRVQVRRTSDLDAHGFTGEVHIFDESGGPVGVLAGLRFERAAAESADAPDADRLFYEVQWQPAPPAGSRLSGGGRILLLADSGARVGAALADCLEARGFECVRVRRGEAYAVARDGTVTVNPAQPEELRTLFAATAFRDGVPLVRVVHLWMLDAPRAAREISDRDIDAAQRLTCGDLLRVAQVLTASALTHPLRFCVITRMAQATGVESGPVDFFQSLPWGLGRTLALEHPEVRPVGIDIDSFGSIEALADEVLSEDRENQVALRHGGRWIARLTRAAIQAPPVARDVPLRLDPSANGVLEDLGWKPASRRSPGGGEVEIEIEAIGLNFRDVMVALGLYPGEPETFGGECAGRVTTVGSGVHRFAPGDAVVAVTPGSFATHVTAPAPLVAHRPADMTAEQAATIPIAFLTAAYALRTIGAVTRGDRVLIHAAAGGVGLAAVQIAQQAGAEIFATAGSAEKRAFLSSIGVRHVMDSRSTAFADEVRLATGGRGVDVVLNSLAGEFIPRSLDALAERGRFLEIGKVDTWSAERVAEIRPDVRYHLLALDVLARDTPLRLQEMFSTLLEEFRARILRPLPYRVFEREHVEHAFRHMAQARHIGKVVVTLRDRRTEVRPDAEYLITGGAGALGLHVAQSLVKRGARHLTLAALADREALSGDARHVLDAIEALGASVRVVKADVSRPDEARRLLEAVRAEGRRLAGVVHAAGTLDDGVLQQLTYERFERVLAPKTAGALHLHALTAADPLDFLVFFSSMIGVLGSPGQASYAAANAFLDGLAHHRRALGRPALSIDWGPWSHGGMADQSRGSRRWAAQGITPIDPATGLAAFWRALASPNPQVGVLPIDWRTFSSAADGEIPPLLESVCAEGTGTGEDRHALLAAIEAALPVERRRVLLEHLQREAASTLGLPATQPLDPRQGFLELGMDSLTGVEFRNRLTKSVGRRFAPTLIFDYPTLDALADHLARDVFGSEAAAPAIQADVHPVVSSAEAPDDLEALLSHIELLSEDAARALRGPDHRP